MLPRNGQQGPYPRCCQSELVDLFTEQRALHEPCCFSFSFFFKFHRRGTPQGLFKEVIMQHQALGNVDTKELELPETTFIRDIEGRLFQSIVIQVLGTIEGIETLEGNLFDDLLGGGVDGVKGIHVTQDQKQHSVNIRIEIKIAYGLSIPLKAEEIQTRIVQEVGRLTSLHVGSVHIVFKDLMPARKKGALESVQCVIEGAR